MAVPTSEALPRDAQSRANVLMRDPKHKRATHELLASHEELGLAQRRPLKLLEQRDVIRR
jgi:hypothetical protein